MNFKRFPDFGKELRRPFQVCEHCYDCVEFYGEGRGSSGCNAWPVHKPFRCADYYPLPPVGINGETGQPFPPSRMKGRKEPRELLASDAPSGSTGPTAARGSRHCECGETLAKGRRLCDQCRIERRQQSRRGYMRGYMRQRRSGVSASATDTPSPPTRRPRTRLVSHDLPPTGIRREGRLF